ncbi:MAG TPA: glycosyltransferase family 4 protein [Candidatus Binatia bacterium]|nr:glycosyltransferase family 4 protein [Candidatus Binatia bacterium]
MSAYRVNPVYERATLTVNVERRRRIAFITPEFVTDHRNAGGLGNYLLRIGKLLVERGHQAEVFVSSDMEPRILMHEGIRVERVSPFAGTLLGKVLTNISRVGGAGYALALATQAWALAAAMQRRHREVPFDIVQSSDYRAVGLAIPRTKGRIHLVRCSTAADLWNEVFGERSTGEKWRERMERATLRRADKAYAPSRFVAAHYLSRYGIAIDVLRPPSGLEVAPSSDPPCGLPERFLLHFGRLGKKTGTPWLSEALKLAFEIEPTLRMVWVGRGNFSEIAALQDTMGQHRRKIQILYPLPKPDLYAVLLRADATVIPSSVDNLPNTAIESLSLGVPVIGTRGASIDELVEDGVTGDLVQPGHVEGLASAIVKFWRGESSVRKGFIWRGGIADEMRPDSAVENLLKLAGVRSEAKMNPTTRLAEHRA